MDRNRQRGAGLLLANGEHVIADMLATDTNHVAAPLRRVQSERHRQAGFRANRMTCLEGTGRELRALRRLQREQRSKSPFIFVSERSAPFAKRGFQAMVERTARAAGFDMKIHPHMLPLQMPRP